MIRESKSLLSYKALTYVLAVSLLMVLVSRIAMNVIVSEDVNVVKGIGESVFSFFYILVFVGIITSAAALIALLVKWLMKR